MDVATFSLKHHASGSRVFIEFVRGEGGAIRIASTTFARGNVVSLIAVREKLEAARKALA